LLENDKTRFPKNIFYNAVCPKKSSLTLGPADEEGLG